MINSEHTPAGSEVSTVYALMLNAICSVNMAQNSRKCASLPGSKVVAGKALCIQSRSRRRERQPMKLHAIINTDNVNVVQIIGALTIQNIKTCM